MKRKSFPGVVLITALMVLIGFTGCEFFEDLFGSEGGGDQIALNSITPAEGIINDTVIVAISGDPLSEEMSPGLQAQLINGATNIPSTKVDVINGGQVNATFTLPSIETPMVMDIYVVDTEGDEGMLSQVFTVREYEILEDPLETPVTVDVSSGDASYDFSEGAECVTTSNARDVTFTLDSGNPAMTITTGGTGGIYNGYEFTSFETASDLESRPAGYARAGDAALPFTLAAGDFYGLLSSTNEFVVLKVESVDTGADTLTFKFMLVRLIETTE